jgi:hypothetical protein
MTIPNWGFGLSFLDQKQVLVDITLTTPLASRFVLPEAVPSVHVFFSIDRPTENLHHIHIGSDHNPTQHDEAQNDGMSFAVFRFLIFQMFKNNQALFS